MQQLVAEYSDEPPLVVSAAPEAAVASDAEAMRLMRMALVPAAPPVQDVAARSKYTTSLNHEVYDNPTYEDLAAPQQGPVQPFYKLPLGFRKNVLTGFVEDLSTDQFTFDEQFHTFHSFGYGVDPASQKRIVGDAAKLAQQQGHSVFDPVKAGKRDKPKRQKGGTAGSGTFLGPWAPVIREGDELAQKKKQKEGEQHEALDDILAGNKSEDEGEADESKPEEGGVKDKEGQEKEKEKETEKEKDKEMGKEPEKEKEKEKDAGKPGVGEVSEGSSVFHLKEARDYLGRSFVQPPSDLKPYPHKCFLPKRWIHTWSGHTKGVSCVRLFPTYGHLLLSAGLDNVVKIWDVCNTMQCIRTYMGHNKGVRDLCQSRDGLRFLSASYDRSVKCWDTETGAVIGTYSNGKIPYCVKLYPLGEQNVFLAGCSDKKILQYDLRTRGICLEYDGHLGAVNTVTFIDDNRRFVSSSDDKSLRIWEWGIPVPIKYVSEPHMHSMPAVTVHPNGKWFVCQSLDNQILVYGARDRFKLNRKKRFSGHVTAGYACGMSFSPDGHYLISGDGEGKLWCWDWKTCRAYKVMKTHESVCIGCEWHPIEASRVVTCGWDGKINYWD
eukprot:TRINITY_DN209_c0_g2_i1.p1 TRINITY_DN209_c0_g2~~TRINITY_DN209_c0_g2_i1.p1  ORF type:complete len:634 (-),score=210.78 TRINITY_DN209_c0_g2_i1:66-1886(-)